MAFVRSVVVESLEWLRIVDLRQNESTVLSNVNVNAKMYFF